MRKPRFILGNSSKVPRKSISDFLKETDFKPLVLVGKAMDYFGKGAVLGFLLGASLVWGYALVEQLPYAGRFAKSLPVPEVAQAKIPESQKQEKITVKGKITDGKNGIKTPFQVGVVYLVSGQFAQGNGSFSLELPKQNTYTVAFWKPNYEDFRLLQLELESDNTFSPVTIWDDIVTKQTTDREPKDMRRASRERKLRSQASVFSEDLNPTTNLFSELRQTSSAD